MMRLVIEKKHSLAKEEAKKRIQELFPELRKEYGGQIYLWQEWEGDELSFSLSVRGFNIFGRILVTDSKIRLETDLPLAAIFFKGRIEAGIRAEMDKIFGA